jgi:protein-tyrosine phosphatase
MFVCTANVCRSPMAEALFNSKIKSAGLTGRYRAVSAGTRVAQRGRPPDPRTIALVSATGGSAKGIRARQLTAARLKGLDLIAVMEQSHVEEVHACATGGQCEVPIRLLGSFVSEELPEIPDPYFSNRAGFERVGARVSEALDALLRELEKGLADDCARGM